MPTRVFVDTNVLVYAFTADAQKGARAEAVMAERPWVSVQGLNELTHVLRRKRKLDWARIADISDTVSALSEVVDLNLECHQRALRLVRRHALGWWDALQLAVALETEAREFLSEDLQHGQVFEGRLRVCNPFLAD
jgi:predicted nucleic acid-binding protein